MAKTIKISNSTDRYIETKYRMPGNKYSIITVTVQPRALLNEINFANEDYYNQWRKQNDTFFREGILIENEKNENRLKGQGDEYNKNVSTKIQTKIDTNVENVQAAADNVNASMKIETEDLRERKPRRRNM